MTDIFDNKILCKDCNKEMQKANVVRNGFLMRAMICEKCGEKAYHPVDLEEYNKFINLKNKTFRVKLRVVGNSYTVSIPKEIVSFMQEQEKAFNDFDKMVDMCFNEMGKLTLDFENRVNNLKENNNHLDTHPSTNHHPAQSNIKIVKLIKLNKNNN